MHPRPGEADVQQPPSPRRAAHRRRSAWRIGSEPSSSIGSATASHSRPLARWYVSRFTPSAEPARSAARRRSSSARYPAASRPPVGPELRRRGCRAACRAPRSARGPRRRRDPRRAAAARVPSPSASYPSFDAHSARIAPLRAGPVAVSDPGRDGPTHEIDRAADLLAGRRSGCRGSGTGSVPASAGPRSARAGRSSGRAPRSRPRASRPRSAPAPSRRARPARRPRCCSGRSSAPGPPAASLEVLGPPGRGEQPVGELQDLRARAVVVAEGHDPGARMPVGEPGQVLAAGAGERVDRLVLVADDAHVLAVARPQLEQALLEQVRVLVLVDAEPALAGADGLGGVGVGLEQVDGLDEQVVEVDAPGARSGRARSRRTCARTGRPGSAPRAAALPVPGPPVSAGLVGLRASVGGSSPIRSRSRGPWPA